MLTVFVSVYLFLVACIICVNIWFHINEPEHLNWQLRVPNTQLLQEVVRFTGPILHENRIRQFPAVKIRYYKHKKIMGAYRGGTIPIVIYLHSHSTVPELVDTALHEVAHYIQHTARPKEFSNYGRYNEVHGYRNNPLEVESRAFAGKYLKSCLLELERKGYIVRC